MQPYSSSRIKQTLNSQGPKTKPQDKGKRRDTDSSSTKSTPFRTIPEAANSYRGSAQKFNSANYPYGYQYEPDAPSSSSAPLAVSADPSSYSHPFLFEGPSASNATSQRRRSKDHSILHKNKKKHQRTGLMTSDAYAEHVLLAAQKIGRKRAALVTLQRFTGREKESFSHEQEEMQMKKEQDRQEEEALGSGKFGAAYYRASTDASPRQGVSGFGSLLPKTPKRSDCTIGPNNNANPGGVNTPPPSTYVFVNTSGTPVPNLPFHNPRSVTNTPSHLGAPVNLTPGIRSTSQNNPPTPMHSLLDAARMMDESNHKLNSKRRSLVDPESPTGKRRRILTEKQSSTRGSSRITRVKSALDVLAESAAAVNDSTKADGSVSAYASDNASKAKANSPESGSEANFSSISRSSTRTIRPSSRKLPVPPDEAKIASSSTTKERGAAKSHGQHKSPAVHETRLIPSASSSLHRIASTGLRPVVVWGDRPFSDEDDEDEDEDGYSDSDAPQTKRHVRQGKVGLEYPRRGHVNNLPGYCPYPTEVHEGVRELASGSLEVLGSNHDSKSSPANVVDKLGTPDRNVSLLSRFHVVPAPETTTHVPLQQTTLRMSSSSRVSELLPTSTFLEQELDHPRSQETAHLPASSTHSLERRIHGTLEADVQGTFAEGNEAIADVAADEDEDAEGEDEEDPENEPEINDRPSRFRSPPPPDPPFFGPGTGNGPPDDEHDADAEGEMDFDERGTSPAGQANSSKPRTETASGQHTDISFWRIHFSLAAIHGTAVYFSTIRFCASSKEKVSFLQLKGPICPDIFPAHHGTEWLSKRGEQSTAILIQCVLLGLYTSHVYTH